MGKLFGTDGIRGVANEELTPELAYRTGQIAGEVLMEGREGRGLVLIGRDTRQSGEMLHHSLVSGLLSTGMDVVDLGVIPTPGVAYLVRKYQADMGIVISASHNPYIYNGIKIFDKTGYKLPDAIEEKIEEKLLNEEYRSPLAHGDDIGRIRHDFRGAEDYKDYLMGLMDEDISDKIIAMDLGNGALSHMAQDVLESLGATVYAINNSPNGKNINDQCGSTDPGKIQALVKEKKADIGLSFDGDADRIIAVDAKGNIIDGDHILAICAMQLKEEGKLTNNMVVGTIMTNIGLDRYLESIGVEITKTKVGDRYVLESMCENNYVLGGEQSGHIIFKDYNTTGDGLATGIHLLQVMAKTGKTSDELNGLMTSYPQVLVNAKVAKDKKDAYLHHEGIQKSIQEVEEKFKGNGRVVIRPSGTEPLVRVMIEGDDQEILEKCARELAEEIERELA
ncbi:phosphoglucosamine mutase [Peptoniphilus sp. KCTC 25270]|uniref:phosphoglucosamine mutase n=1 Tax=Peptoniphilus sp. KCTC 25270 TaxID=2897414 RepID=UPI001E4BA792|nr:phosphoglucosamine mutase [Peptoniphilus sp. KCTC 25270]MCD1147307.1 phosphoglucosamine mutase [Peptoniphilus sp. KCTC 25270]